MRCLFSISMPPRAHLISLYKLSPNQTFTLTEKCCPGEREICKDRLSVLLRCSAESGKKLESLTCKFKNSLYIHNFAVCIKLKKKTTNTYVWQSVWGMAPTSKVKNSCQNVNIVLLGDKHATHTHWYLKQVSGFFSLPASSMAMCSH